MNPPEAPTVAWRFAKEYAQLGPAVKKGVTETTYLVLADGVPTFGLDPRGRVTRREAELFKTTNWNMV